MSKQATAFQWLLNCTEAEFNRFLHTPPHDVEPEYLEAYEAILFLAED